MPLPDDAVTLVSRSFANLTYLPTLKAVIPARIEATTSSSHWSYDVTLVIRVADGQTVVDELRIRRLSEGGDISSESLRSVPIASIVRHAVRTAAIPARKEKGQLSIEVFGPDQSTLDVNAVEKALPRRRAPRSPAEHRKLLTEVVNAYRVALDDPNVGRPRAHVAQLLGYSNSHIGKLLSEARKLGLLGPAPGPGRAGEIRKAGKEKR
jgi:hypothetical protein